MRAKSLKSVRTDGARGFTLIELLVVIAIITVLVGILIPTLSGVRAYAKKVKCQTNLKSFGQSFQMYTAQNKDLLPSVRPFYDPANTSPNDPALLEILAAFMNVNTPVRVNEADPDSPYIPVDPFFCPSDRNALDEAGLSLGISYEYWPGLMMLFAEGPLFGDKIKSQKLVSQYWIANPNKVPVLSDAKPWHKVGSGTGQNGLFFGDWHVTEIEGSPRDGVVGAPITPPPPPPPPPTP